MFQLLAGQLVRLVRPRLFVPLDRVEQQDYGRGRGPLARLQRFDAPAGLRPGRLNDRKCVGRW